MEVEKNCGFITYDKVHSLALFSWKFQLWTWTLGVMFLSGRKHWKSYRWGEWQPRRWSSVEGILLILEPFLLTTYLQQFHSLNSWATEVSPLTVNVKVSLARRQPVIDPINDASSRFEMYRSVCKFYVLVMCWRTMIAFEDHDVPTNQIP